MARGARVVAADAAQQARIADHAAGLVDVADLEQVVGVVERARADLLVGGGGRRQARQVEVELELAADTVRLQGIDVDRA